MTDSAERSQTPSFRDGPQDQTSDVHLHIGESRDSGSDASHRPGMTESGLLRRSAPRNDGTLIPDTTSRPRDAMRPRRYLNLPPKEGVGNAGCPMHPRPRVHL